MMWRRISRSQEKSPTELTLLSCIHFCLHAANGPIYGYKKKEKKRPLRVLIKFFFFFSKLILITCLKHMLNVSFSPCADENILWRFRAPICSFFLNCVLIGDRFLLLKWLGLSSWIIFFFALVFTLLLYCALFTAINNCPHHIMKCLCAWQYTTCC